MSFANNCLGRHKKLPFYHCFPPESFDSNAKLFFSHFSERPSNLSIKKSFLQLSVSFRFFIRFSMIVCLASFRTLVGPSIRPPSKSLCTRFYLLVPAPLRVLVGPSGLEPPTSCLSGTRSNLLSYEPMQLISDCSHLNYCPLSGLGGDDWIT